MSEIHYQRLTRSRARSVFTVALRSRVSLWLGPDHLLCVDSTGYSETYKRFYFRDIQAIIVRESRRRTVWNVILVVPIIGCLAGLLTNLSSMPNDHLVVLVWLGLSALFLAPFLLNNFVGTACVCHLRTAVQIEELPSLCRVRKTRRILEKIRPLIIAAQGDGMSADVVSAKMRDWVASAALGSPAGVVAADPNVPPDPAA